MVNNVTIKRVKIQQNFEILLCETQKNKAPSKSSDQEVSIEWSNRRIITTENQKLEKPYQNPSITPRVKGLDNQRFQNVITFNLFFKLKLTSLSRDQKK